METAHEAHQYIATCIAGPSNETDPTDFDIDAIARDLYGAAGGTWDITHLEHDLFWEAVTRHAKDEA